MTSERCIREEVQVDVNGDDVVFGARGGEFGGGGASGDWDD
jgi:uncharacterized membrane protein YgcG